jgi:dolichol-phosphate mannosyltransferase
MVLNLSVVIPFFNEAECLEEVCMEASSVLKKMPRDSWQLVMVDDGSSDATAEIIDRLAAAHPQFLAVHLIPNSGQSAALEAGFAAASGELIATLDGDGQNDPADLPALIQEMERLQVDMMCGVRQRRADNWIRRLSSRIANRVRSRVLRDGITDVGCSIRVFRRSCLGRIRFFRNAHRFFPALFQIAGYSVAEMPVNHRQRLQGVSKYGGGIQSRLWVGLADLAGVYWLRKRALLYEVSSSASLEGKAGDKGA